MLNLSNICVSHGAIRAVRDVSLQIGDGEVVALLGPNGAGKSSLLDAAAGLAPITSGTITLDGIRIDTMPGCARAELGMGYCPERRAVFPGMTVRENLSLGANLSTTADARRRETEMFALFPRLSERAGQVAGTLSGGERQMLGVAQALMSRPRLLLLDEPVQGLAPQVVAQLYAAIEKMVGRDQLSVLLVEQSPERAFSLARRGYVMQAGEVIGSGRPDELLSSSPVGYG